MQVGSLGLPGTQWCTGAILDADAQAQGLSNFLWELCERGELCVDPSLYVIIMGFGCGANAVLKFAATHLMDTKFSRLRCATRLLAVVNPFPLSPNNSMISRKVKRSLQTLKRTLESGSNQEQLQSIMNAFFSANYIATVSNPRKISQETVPIHNMFTLHCDQR